MGLAVIVLLLLGCAAAPVLEDVRVVPLEAVQTVLIATWTSDVPCVGRVGYGVPGEASFTTEWEPGPTTKHARRLLNLPSETAVDWTLRCDADNGTSAGDTGRALTGALPAALSDLYLSGDPDPGTDLLAMSTIGGVAAATLYDLRGRIVWYHEEDPGAALTRAQLSVDGQHVQFLVTGSDDADVEAGIVRMNLLGEELDRLHPKKANHDFVELADGTITAIVDDVRTVEDQRVVGNALVATAPDGTERTIWSSFDTFDPLVDHPHYDDSVYTHANALDVDTGGTGYWLGLRNFDTLLHIADSGEIVASIGGDSPSLPYLDDASAMSGQHQFDWFDADHVVVFDNGYTTQSSRVVEYAVDEARGGVTETWSWTPDPEIWNYALGDVARDADGGTRITYSLAGIVVQLDAEGDIRWQMFTPLGAGLGYSTRIPALK